MTTRSGFIGLLTGLAATLLLLYPLAIAEPTNSTPRSWAIVIATLLFTLGGALAAHWGGSNNPVRCAALGGLSGGLAGAVIFCLLGAAAGLNSGAAQQAHANAIIRQTELAFIISFFGGVSLGALGGWLFRPRVNASPECFDKSAPQMALNAAITAVPASIVAAAASALIFPVSDFPLETSLTLVLISHTCLTFIVPHEARQAEHRCGMDEVKMAAYVGIGAFPLISLSLLLIKPGLFTKPFVIVFLILVAILSLRSGQILFKMILPMRAFFPIPQDNQQKLEAKLFGTIASSRGSRLVVLCIGCGMVMILPLHVTVISVLINLNCLLLDPSLTQLSSTEMTQKLFLSQALVSSGLVIASATILSAIYLFYLTLGRWFSRRERS